jgi:AraC family transcriptional regulator
MVRLESLARRKRAPIRRVASMDLSYEPRAPISRRIHRTAEGFTEGVGCLGSIFSADCRQYAAASPGLFSRSRTRGLSVWAPHDPTPNRQQQFLIRDPVIEAITLNLAREAAGGSPAGRLYVESGCEFLAHHLIYRYSSLSPAPPRSMGGLSSRRLRLVLEYIEDTLGQPIKLRELAALAGISARHFERAFRQSTGSSPHAYVMDGRLHRARDLLINQPELPIEQIALRLGFSSSSHFSSAFRRQTGLTPTDFRKTCSQ